MINFLSLFIVFSPLLGALFLLFYPNKSDFKSSIIANISVGNVYNRMVAYRGKTLYHRSILPGFGTTLETSRLTQTFFFSVNGQK